MTQTAFVRNALRLLWFVLGAGLIGWIAARNLPADGRLVARVRAAEPSGFVGGLTPTDRAKIIEGGDGHFTEVVDEPAYFHIARPRLYPKVTVRMRFRNEGQPLVELGGRTSLDAWGFDLKPLDAPMLDGLGWPAWQDGPYRVYERKASARSASEILASSDGRIGVYHADPVRWGLRLPEPRSAEPVEVLERLPGPRVLYTYVHRAPFGLTLALDAPVDAVVQVRVLHEGEVVMTRGLESGAGSVELGITNAKPGLYRVEIEMPTDAALTQVRSEQQKLVFVDTAGEKFKAFAPASAFEPEHHVVTWESDVGKARLEAIVAAYRPPTVDASGWKVAEAEFDLGALAPDRGRIQMALSLPAIKAVGGRLLVDWIEAEYVREPLSVSGTLTMLKELKGLITQGL